MARTNTVDPSQEPHKPQTAEDGQGELDPHRVHHVTSGDITNTKTSSSDDSDSHHEEGWEIDASRSPTVQKFYEDPPVSTKRRVKQIVLISTFVTVLAAGATLFYVFYTGNNVNIPKTELTVQDILDAFLEDPWDYGPGTAQEQINWSPSSSRNGLNLRVINALTPDWNQYYEESMADWENGAPDALTLRSEMAVQPDPACLPVTGAMKVCNNDYGENGWKGLNEVLVTSQGIIVVSVAKMNEWYLSNSNSAERRYTMCHELGHGFGLNHADENFRNRDLGTCMDYTVRPQNNLLPNLNDYETLAMLYGIAPNATTTVQGAGANNAFGGGQNQQQPWSFGDSMNNGNNGQQKDKQKEENKNKEDRRLLRKPREVLLEEHQDIPIGNLPSFSDESDRHHWRLLGVHRGGEIHERTLPGGNRIIARLLLAHDIDDDDETFLDDIEPESREQNAHTSSSDAE